jgi:hypothetical protein
MKKTTVSLFYATHHYSLSLSKEEEERREERAIRLVQDVEKSLDDLREKIAQKVGVECQLTIQERDGDHFSFTLSSSQ